jgi:hypothetical protein
MHRRRFLGLLAIAPLLAAARSAHAQANAPAGPRLRSLERDARGTTLLLALESAPFPSPGSGYFDDTVIVFVPAHYRYRPDEGVAALVHFHGHSTTADRAMAAHELREQLADSRQNAILIVPQLAVNAADSACGKLESPGGFARLLRGAVETAAREGRTTLDDTAFPADARLGTVCVSAHSGGYHAAAAVLRQGGVDVRETYLFDALYAEGDTFRDWVLARHGQPLHDRHKLVSYFVSGGTTDVANRWLRAELEKGGALCEEEQQEGELSRHELSHAEAVFVRTGLWHNQVTWETNALRDCLFASALPRHLSSDWFARKHGARPIDKRQR